MRIIISAYVFLAFASWSALAAPFSGFERDDKNGNSHTNIFRSFVVRPTLCRSCRSAETSVVFLNAYG